MRQLLKISVAASALFASAAFAQADCGIPAGSVRILSNDFEALHVVARTAEECASPTVKVTKNQTTEHNNIPVTDLTTTPATYSNMSVSNSSLASFLNAGLVRPLDDFIGKFGKDLNPNQLIKIEG